LPLDTKGVLVSCIAGKERNAGLEAISILTEAYEALVPDHNKAADGSGDKNDDVKKETTKDISSLLAEEVADLNNKDKHLFYFHDLKMPGMVYVEAKYKGVSPTPAELLIWTCERIHKEQQRKARLCNRFYPIDTVIEAEAKAMEKLANVIAEEHFPASKGEETEGVQFAVQENRRVTKMDRMELINAFVAPIPQPPHKVNLDNPKKTIVLNVIKGRVGVAVTGKYKELNKFNVLINSMGAEEKEALKTTKPTGPSKAEEEKE